MYKTAVVHPPQTNLSRKTFLEEGRATVAALVIRSVRKEEMVNVHQGFLLKLSANEHNTVETPKGGQE